MKEKMDSIISRHLEKTLGYWRQPDETFKREIYADYRDKMNSESAIKILESPNPSDAFWEMMCDWYDDYSCDLKNELKKEIVDILQYDNGPCPEGLTDEEDDLLNDWLLEKVNFAFPEKHYLEQPFHVDIMVDTGDGNHDYTLNCVYPAYCGRYGETIDDKASIVWLARQQGYTKRQLRRALKEGDVTNPKGFLESVRAEVANIASPMQILTFLVEMTLEDLIKLNELIGLQYRNGYYYDSKKNPYCGYIVLDQKTTTGLYDPWSGGGSLFEIKLEKDVRLPIRFIRSALPDGGDGHSVDSVYGMVGSVWQRGGVKTIHAPRNIKKVEV